MKKQLGEILHFSAWTAVLHLPIEKSFQQRSSDQRFAKAFLPNQLLEPKPQQTIFLVSFITEQKLKQFLIFMPKRTVTKTMDSGHQYVLTTYFYNPEHHQEE